MMGLIVVVTSRSKSRQKVEKLSKSPKASKAWKICKDHRFGGMFTEVPILRQFIDTKDSVRALTVFWALFARPRSSLNTMFKSIIDKAKLMELPMLYRVFPQMSQEDLQLCTKFLSVKRTSSLRYFNSGNALRKKTSQPRIDGLGGCWGSCASPRPVLRSRNHQNWAD